MIILDGKKEEDLIKCKEIIMKGGIIVYPTDTIYGLGCDPYNKKSVGNIFRLKNRLMNKALPILTCDVRHVEKIMILNGNGRKLANSFWPGPLTIVGTLKDNDIPKVIRDENKPYNQFSLKGSTIVDVSTSNIKIVREGVIKSETIYEILY